MIGVGLISASSVAVASAEATANAEITKNYPVDYILSSINLGDADPPPGLPAGLADRLRADRTFDGVARVRQVRATLDGTLNMEVGAVDPAGAGVVTPHAVSGSAKALSPGTAALNKAQAKELHKKVGQPITVVTDDGRRATLTVVAITEGAEQLGMLLVDWTDLAALHQGGDDSLVLVRTAGGVSAQHSRDRLDADLTSYPLVQVESQADWREEITGAVHKIIALVAGLLGFAILIALIGIMNTLSLSVLERTRESAVVRALGLTRGQLRGTLLVEALLMALVGAVVGVAFGVLYGWITTGVMFKENDLVMQVPVGQLVGYVALAAVAGVIAAVVPARRAARTSVVSAMAET
jgi:putative ABC transport system permease protein